MSTFGLIEYENASPAVRAVYDDIKVTRKIDKVTNFWKALAHDPTRLKRIWEDTKEIMGPGALDPLVKELIYVAISVSNQCDYCIASHTAAARKKGMTDAMFNEMMPSWVRRIRTTASWPGIRWRSMNSSGIAVIARDRTTSP